MRWQPWVYVYLLMLLPYLFQSDDHDNAKSILNCSQWIIAGVYVWSGIHKLNPNFLDVTFTQLMSVLGIETDWQNFKKIGYIPPFIEILIGIALLVPKFRKIATYCAVIMHTLIFVYFSPIVLHYNSVVLPWNLAMIAFVLLLFWNRTDSPFLSIQNFRLASLRAIIIGLVWLLPFLNTLGYWDHYLSFSFYSDKQPNFFIAIEKTQLQKIDKHLERYFANIRGLQGGQVIEVNKWALSELNVPFYPETRCFKKLTTMFCALNIAQDKLVFLEVKYLSGKPNYKTFTCGD
jgi:hypothetical protein